MVTTINIEAIALLQNLGKTSIIGGKGRYIESYIPDINPFNLYSIPVPCIEINSTTFVWRFEWTAVHTVFEFDRLYGSRISAIQCIPPEGILPVKAV